MIALVTSVMVVSIASAAGSYDGKWVGTAPDAGDCGVLTVTLAISGTTISGTVAGEHGSPSIKTAAVAADGSAHMTYGTQPFEANARFSGSQFSGQFMTFCGIRQVTGTRQ
jgi:hypothetical protein